MRMPQYPAYPRTTAYAEHGMAATSHPVATLAAVDILRAGGNAMDAAVAASVVQGVVEPMSTGIGGDVFCLYAPAGGGEPVAFNGSGRAPRAVDPEALLGQNVTEVLPDSPHSVTVPGAIDAYCQLLADHGRLGIDQVFAPAIELADNGYVVASVVARSWANSAARLGQDAHASATFLPGGSAPTAGQRFQLPALAETLRKVAADGRQAFYEGEVAEHMVSRLRELGGVHEMSDFASGAGEYVTPIRIPFAGYEVYECPPNGQGVIALQMLRILEGFELHHLDPLGAERLHLTLEAGRLAFRDRATHVADPDFATVTPEQLLGDEHVAELRAAISPLQAMPSLPATALTRGDTVYISVVDKDRNAASFISSLYLGFGSCIFVPECGVMLHCRGAGFVVAPGHPNCIGSNKRPMHTIIPGMLMQDGQAVMPFGVMGADYQPWGHVHLLQNILFYGMAVQEALNLPRFTHDNGHAIVEEGVPSAVARELARLGHEVSVAPEPLGGGQAIWIDREQGTLAGGTEPRKDGIALGY